jgi:hypothetical protein
MAGMNRKAEFRTVQFEFRKRPQVDTSNQKATHQR